MSVSSRRITTEDGDRLIILLDGTPVATVDLRDGASATARDSLQKLGVNLEELLAAEWARD